LQVETRAGEDEFPALLCVAGQLATQGSEDGLYGDGGNSFRIERCPEQAMDFAQGQIDGLAVRSASLDGWDNYVYQLAFDMTAAFQNDGGDNVRGQRGGVEI